MRNKDKPALKLPILLEITRFKSQQLRDNVNKFKQTLSSLEDADLYDTVEKWARDVVYQEFKVEE